ncbi:hypothetical protein BDV36DRAFT_243181 [Aspergillus pseudocaelatus]|uniref:Uncharacterized protein n=1 Tax=Aspergillus pseudocaelatus TaxID=1825620 RepID=A0ABQ6X1R1_9EURO|nr:hypothetical protein BDV36DRAFT_243181 [Aspergillus pseudocaelatus]
MRTDRVIQAWAALIASLVGNGRRVKIQKRKIIQKKLSVVNLYRVKDVYVHRGEKCPSADSETWSLSLVGVSVTDGS